MRTTARAISAVSENLYSGERDAETDVEYD